MIATRKYNPAFLTDDQLVESFCVRTHEFDSIFEILSECTGSSNPHQIVIGPRGSGKTSLLLRIAAEIHRDTQLSSAFFPIVFAEESYEVSTAGEFWLECLSRLAVQTPTQRGHPDLHRTFDDLRTIRDDATLAERCLGALLDYSDRANKRLVLVVENLNMMFRDMMDPDAGWRLRKILQTEPRIVLLASATSRFDEIDNPKQALFDLFRVSTLRPLDTNECAILWETVSGRAPPRKTIRSLEILTGGSPRLLTIVARFGAGRSFRELMAELLDLVDDHTEFFKSHLESLPVQERRVYLALADLWKPATTREVADRARLDTSKCSAQLSRLIERGVVQVAGGTARRKQYYLTERLYNIYYLLRRPRGQDSLIHALILFMESYYSPPELREIGERIVREVGSFDAEMQLFHQTALARLIMLPAMVGHREELLAMIPKDFTDILNQYSVFSTAARTVSDSADPEQNHASQLDVNTEERAELATAKALFDKTVELRKQGRADEALAVCDEVVCRFEKRDAPDVIQLVARALANKGRILHSRNRLAEALATCDEVVRRFGVSEKPALLAQVARALVNKGTTLTTLSQLDEALAAYDEVVRRFGENNAPAVLELVATAFTKKVIMLTELNRAEEALATVDEVMLRFGACRVPTFHEHIAKALACKAAMLGRLNRPHEALAAYDEVVQRVGGSDAPNLLTLAALALAGKGGALGQLNRPAEALTAFDQVLRRFGDSEIQSLHEYVAMALVGKGTVLGQLDRLAEALTTYDEAVNRFKASDTPTVLDSVARALIGKGVALGVLDRHVDALATYNEAVRLFGESDVPSLLEQVAIALINIGITLERLDQSEDALASYAEVVRRFGASDELVLLELVAGAFINSGKIFGRLNRIKDSLGAYDEVVRRFEGSESTVLVEQVAMALFMKGLTLGGLNRVEDALAVYDEVTRRFEASDVPALRVLSERSLLGKADIQLRRHQYEAAIEATDQLIQRPRTKSSDTHWWAHVIRAKSILASGNPRASETDISALLVLLSELRSLPREYLHTLMRFSVEIGTAHMRDLIRVSPAATLLLPLTTALEQELGLEPRVAREVQEIAQDVRRDLAKFNKMRTDGAE